MAEYSIASINTSIVDTLSTATGIKRVQDLDEITTSIPNMDLPLLVVYPDSGAEVAQDSNTQQNTFGGGTSQKIIQREWTYICDLYVRQRSLLSLALPEFAQYTQAVIDVMDAQPTNALFGDPAIKSFQYTWERVTITWSNADYDASRLTINVRIY